MGQKLRGSVLANGVFELSSSGELFAKWKIANSSLVLTFVGSSMDVVRIDGFTYTPHENTTLVTTGDKAVFINGLADWLCEKVDEAEASRILKEVSSVLHIWQEFRKDYLLSGIFMGALPQVAQAIELHKQKLYTDMVNLSASKEKAVNFSLYQPKNMSPDLPNGRRLNGIRCLDAWFIVEDVRSYGLGQHIPAGVELVASRLKDASDYFVAYGTKGDFNGFYVKEGTASFLRMLWVLTAFKNLVSDSIPASLDGNESPYFVTINSLMSEMIERHGITELVSTQDLVSWLTE